MSQEFVTEPGKQVKIIEDADVCVIGGSCTGVFAAIRASRLGAKAVLVEKQNSFGGVATSGLVNIWHSLHDTAYERQIIAGLSLETIERLKKRNAAQTVENNPSIGYKLNTEELKIELDELVTENNITPILHAFYAGVITEGDEIKAVLVETKSGRFAIRAKVYIDASGDGDLARDAGFEFTLSDHMQPPTTCAKLQNLGVDVKTMCGLVKEHREEFNLERDAGWWGGIPGTDVWMHAHNHVFGTDVSDFRQLTAAEIEGRRQIRAHMDIVRKYGAGNPNPVLIALPSYIGARESRRFSAEYKLTEDDVLWGKHFDDAIANGSYRVDVHNKENGGFVFKYLDGTTNVINYFGSEKGRWRDPIENDPTFYQIPYRTMINGKCKNLIMAGRMISSDAPAFGAIRVMINLNQTGEAAGVAAYLALNENISVGDVDTAKLRKTLSDGGSIII